MSGCVGAEKRVHVESVGIETRCSSHTTATWFRMLTVAMIPEVLIEVCVESLSAGIVTSWLATGEDQFVQLFLIRNPVRNLVLFSLLLSVRFGRGCRSMPSLGGAGSCCTTGLSFFWWSHTPTLLVHYDIFTRRRMWYSEQSFGCFDEGDVDRCGAVCFSP